MNLSRDERRRLGQIADHLRLEDPELWAALSGTSATPQVPPRPADATVGPLASCSLLDTSGSTGRYRPHGGGRLAGLTCGVTALSLLAAGIAYHQVALIAAGLGVAATRALVQLVLRGCRPRIGEGDDYDD